MKTMVQNLLKEFNQEAEITRKFLERLPEDKWEWKPHEKSMSLAALATHLTDIPSWIHLALQQDVLDVSGVDWDAMTIKDKQGLTGQFEKNLEKSRQDLQKASDEDLVPNWTMKNGEEVYFSLPKGDVLRVSLSQTIHHRAQLGVYYRLLNIPVPTSYGPTADEAEF